VDLTQRETEKYRKVYEQKIYRRGPGVNHVPVAIEKLGCKGGESVTDYGCGAGDALVLLQDHLMEVIGTDIVDCLFRDFKYYVPFVEGAIWDLADIPVTDYAFTSHMLEHLPPEKVDDSLKVISDHTVKGAYLHVYHLPDACGKFLGEPLHLTIQTPEWWRTKISKYFTIQGETTTMSQAGPPRETTFIGKPKRKKRKTAIPEVRMPKSNDTCFIVGHGPSACNSGLGKIIDSYDNVVRFSWRQGQPAEDFGTKVDFTVSSIRDHGSIINEGIKSDKGTWIFGRPGQVDYKTAMWLMNERLVGYMAGCGREVWPWYFRYQELGATGYIDPRMGPPGLIPSFSRGTATLIMACIRLNPKRIDLIGFDNVMKGTRAGYNDWTSMRNSSELRESGHDMRVERLLVDELQEHYNVEIGAINGGKV
jgi:SAM-dependent methyltransferase